MVRMLRQAFRGGRPRFIWVTLGFNGESLCPALSDGWARDWEPLGRVLSGKPGDLTPT